MRDGSSDASVRRIRKFSEGQFPCRTGSSLYRRASGRSFEPLEEAPRSAPCARPGWRNPRPSVEAGPDPVRNGMMRWRRNDPARGVAAGLAWRSRPHHSGQPLAADPATLWPGPEPGRERLTLPAGKLSDFDTGEAIVEPCCANGTASQTNRPSSPH